MPPLGPRTQTKESRGALVQAFRKRQKNLRQLDAPAPSRPNVPARMRPEESGHLRAQSDVRHALDVGERVYKRYAKGNYNILTKPDDPHTVLQNRPFPYGSLSQVERVNYESLSNDLLKHLADRFGGKVSKTRIGSARELAAPAYDSSGYAYLGRKGVYVSPGAVLNAFAGRRQARDFALKIPVHEFAHTRQRPSTLTRALSEGGADLFMRAVAPAMYDYLGVSGITNRPSNRDYDRYARSVIRRGGLRYVLQQQFR